jgi:hypothetical protein
MGDPDMTESKILNDPDIRAALFRQRLRRQKTHPNTLVINELGLAHAKSRIDVAVINGCIHGYEIKSAKDSLERLGSQIDIYRQTLQKLTIVAASKHLDSVISLAPDWCGIIEAEQGPRYGIRLNITRIARTNPEIEPVMMAHLLWRTEVIDILVQNGFQPKELRRPRKQLYEMLCEALTLREITTAIRTFMMQRQTWRDHPPHV